MDSSKEHLVLIDGHHLLYRAYWAIPRTMKTSTGEQVNTTFGMASMILNILKTEQPTHLVICFDEGSETFRHQENETYKEGRAETPDDFYPQLPRVLEFIATAGFPSCSNKQYEADDLLCTYAKLGEDAGMRVTIVTGDRDAFQLATKNVRIAIPHSGYLQAEYLGPEEIEAKYGIRPDQVPAYKGLVGDPSDNLPGVNGIGPKGAAELLQTYQTLEAVYENLGDIRPALRMKLERDREMAFFCQHMALLVCDVPLDIALPDTRLQSLHAAGVLEFFGTLEFSLLTRRFKEVLTTSYGQSIFEDALESAKNEQTIVQPSNQLTLF